MSSPGFQNMVERSKIFVIFTEEPYQTSHHSLHSKMNLFENNVNHEYVHSDYTERIPQEKVVVTPLSSSSLPIEPTFVNDTESSLRQITPTNDTTSDLQDNRSNHTGRKRAKLENKTQRQKEISLTNVLMIGKNPYKVHLITFKAELFASILDWRIYHEG